MAKKRKKQRKSSASHKKVNTTLTLEAQEQRVQTLYASGKYKEASECCKILLKQDKRPEWLEMLAAIYHERSKELAAKKMYKEAIMIWRNRADLCNKSLLDAFYVKTLFAADMSDQVLTLYQQNKDELEQAGVLVEIREHLAAVSLGQSNEILKALPVDDILVKDYPIALSAMEAYCSGNDEVLLDRLKEISFRSPFRDLRQILKALLLPQDDNLAIKKLLDRVSLNSPFMPLANAVLFSCETNNQLYANIAKLDRETMQFVMEKRGFDARFIKFADEVSRLGGSPSAKHLLRFVLSHRETLGVDYARDIALRLLVHFSGGTAGFVKIFGTPSALEQAQIDVWQNEAQEAHHIEILRAWSVVESSFKPEHCESLEDYQLSVALISRRVLQKVDGFAPNGEQYKMVNKLLERIIVCDPEDHASYARLITSYREQGDLKQARYWIDQAMENFSDNVSILTEAVETALASNAYKKAAVLAKRILAKDPINKRVRSALIDSHLSHARKLIDKNKTALAEKELDIAESWVKVSTDKARVDLVRGVWLLDDTQPTEAAAIWKTATDVLGGGLCGHFYLLLELLNHNRSVATVLKKTGIDLTAKSLSKNQVFQFFHLLKSFDKNRHADEIFSAIDLLEPILEDQVIKFKYSISELEEACEILCAFGLHRLSLKYAVHARKQWLIEPVFIYHEIAARNAIDGYLSHEDFNTLNNLVSEADDVRINKKLKHCIISLLNDAMMPPDSNPVPDLDNLIDMMIEMMPASEIKKLKQGMNEESFRAFIKDMLMNDYGDEILGDADDDLNPLELPPKKRKKISKNEGSSQSDQQLELF